jgi:ATP-dependent DNA helicase DinG
MDTSARLLGPNGPFAAKYAHYEPRTAQIEMATAVERAIEEERVLLCEAGTGTGKTLAYLVPALQSGKRVVVSTATRALQEQIVNHDLPWITDALGYQPRIAVMKGLSNYVCRRRLAEHLESRTAQGRVSRSLRQILEFSQTSTTGDISHIAELSEEDPEWSEVTSSSDTRVGSSCEYFETCFVTRMRRQAELAQLVVVNHHLYFADLALRGAHPGRILPNYDVVIFDEAHQLEDTATEFFGTKISSRAMTRMVRDLGHALETAQSLGFGAATTALKNLAAQLQTATTQFFDAVQRCAAGDGRAEVDVEELHAQAKQPWLQVDSLLEAIAALAQTTMAILPAARSLPEARTGNVKDALEVAARRIGETRSRLQELMESTRGRVVWTERTERGASLTSSPIELGDLLKDRIFDAIPSVVLTSATLTAQRSLHESAQEGQFEYLRQRLGITDLMAPVDSLVVPSPFDFKRHALLYTPRDLPAPNTEEFIEHAAVRIKTLIDLTAGGAFVLTTSLRSMHALHERLKSVIELPLLLQGELPKAEILQRFRASGNAVLVATSSFWEGVDVAGFALRLVVLEKIPFQVPSDPLVRARSLSMEAQGRNPFTDYALPAAAIALKQGFGRLIRSSQDKGIVALLDERVHRRGYGQRLLASLPPAQRVTRLEDVQRFWELASQGPA